MRKTKNEKNQKVSSFYVSTKPRTRVQKEIKTSVVDTPIANRTRQSTKDTVIATEHVANRTRQGSKTTKPLLKPISDISNVSNTRTVKRGSKLPAVKTEQKPNATLDSFVKNQVVKVKTNVVPGTKSEQKPNAILDTYMIKKRKQDNISKQKDESFKENTPVKRVSTVKPQSRSEMARRRRALFERVRAKGQKTLEETLQGMDPAKKKQKAMLSRAREIANSLSLNKTVMFVKEAATRIVESSDVPISEYEAIEHFELLTKIAPKWCQFSTNKIKNDLLTINTSMPTWEVREIVDKGVKNF